MEYGQANEFSWLIYTRIVAPRRLYHTLTYILIMAFPYYIYMCIDESINCVNKSNNNNNSKFIRK